MSGLADRRYSDPTYERMREMIDAFVTCGGELALCEQFGVGWSTIDRWRLGVTTPNERTRDLVIDFISRKVAP